MAKKKLFSELLDDWLKYKNLSIEEATQEDYRLLIKQISNFLGDIFVEDITIEDIQNYYSAEKNRGSSINTIKHKHVIIKPALDYAVAIRKLINSNPAQYIRFPKKKKFIPQVLTLEELKYLLKQERNNLIEFGIFCAAVYGMRRSEIIGLKWSAINFKENIFIMNNTVIRKKVNGGRKLLERPYGKNNTSTRIFPITPSFKELLMRIKENQAILKENDANYNNKNLDYIFLNFDGNLINPDHVSTLFKKALIKHEFPMIRFHDLRHSCATFMQKNKISAKDIQSWLGHSSISTTMNIYTHLDLNDKTEVAEKIEDILK